jgi:hypothetical protein
VALCKYACAVMYHSLGVVFPTNLAFLSL